MKAFLQTVHRWTQIHWNIFLVLLVGMFIYVILKTGWLMLNAPDKMTVEVISSTAVEEVAPVATNITTPPTEAVVEKFMRQGITIVTNQPGRVEFRNVGGPEDMPVIPQPPSRTN